MKFHFLTVIFFLFLLLLNAEAFASCTPSFSRPLAHQFIIFLTYLLMLFVAFGGLFSAFKSIVFLKKKNQGWRTQVLHVVLWALGFCVLFGIHYLGFIFFQPKSTFPRVGEGAIFDDYFEYFLHIVTSNLQKPDTLVLFLAVFVYWAAFYALKKYGICSAVIYRIAVSALSAWFFLCLGFTIERVVSKSCCPSSQDLTVSSCPVSRDCVRCD